MKKTFVRVLAAIAAVCSLAALFAFAGCNKKKPEETKYTVTYAVGEGATGTAPAGGEFEAGATFALPAATGLAKEDYTFEAWNDGAADYAAGATFTMPAKNVTFTAKWKANQVEPPVPVTYTVTFAKGAEDATGTAPTLAAQASGAAVTLPANTFTYEGHTFKGWKASTDNQVYQPEATYTMTAANVTFTAQWEANGEEPPVPVTQYTVTFDPNNEEDTWTETVNEGSTVAKPTDPVHPNGKTFMYWKNGSGKEYNFNSSVTGDLELTAVYAWKLTFLAGSGATGTVEPLFVTFGFAVLPDGTGLSNGDKVFDGWTTDGTNKYEAGSMYNATANETFTAVWKEKQTTFTLSYGTMYYGEYPGEGDAPASVTKNEGDTVTLPENMFTAKAEYSNYVFVGWYVQGVSSVLYQPGDTYTMPAKDVKFMAKWEEGAPVTPTTFTVTYKAGDHATGTDITESHTKGEITLKAADVFTPESNYLFAGWKLEGGSEYDVYAVGGTYNLTGNVTFIAQWTQTIGAYDNDESVMLLLDISDNTGTLTDFGGDFEEALTFTLTGNDITITLDEQTFNGTYENGALNITLTYKGKSYTFGSPTVDPNPPSSIGGWVAISTTEGDFYNMANNSEKLYFEQSFVFGTTTFVGIHFTYNANLGVRIKAIYLDATGAEKEPTSAISIFGASESNANQIVFSAGSYEIIIGQKEDGKYYVTSFRYGKDATPDTTERVLTNVKPTAEQ